MDEMRAACPTSLRACPSACLHGRILAAFHKTSSALPVAPWQPSALHHGHAASHAAEWHGSTQYDGSEGRASGSGWRWATQAGWNLRNRHGPGRPAMAAWLLVLQVLLVLGGHSVPTKRGRLLTMFVLNKEIRTCKNGG